MNILCLALYDALWGQCRNQALLLKVLKENKNTSIVYYPCGTFIKDYCNAMANRFIQISDPINKKQEVCLECCSNSRLIVETLGFKSFALANEHKYKQERSLSKLNISRWAMFEAIILSKNLSSRLCKTGKAIYTAIKNNSKNLNDAYKEALHNTEPASAITQHTAYSYNRVFNEMCKKRSIPCYSLNSSLNFAHPDTKALIFRDAPIDFYNSSIKDWPVYRNISVNKEEANLCKDHLISLMEGKGFAYSKKIVARKAPNNVRHKKHVVIFLSSYDELLASKYSGFMPNKENHVFHTQIDWVRWIYDYAKKKNQWKFTIRPHPREFTSYTENSLSQHALKLIEIFKDRPTNVEINLPDQNISAYDLLFDCDLVLFSWSSVGLEASMLGIPAITYFPEALLHPNRIVKVCQSRKEMQLSIERCLKTGRNIQRSINAFRWANYLFNATTVDLAEKNNLRNKISLWLTKKLPINKRTKRKLEIFLTMTGNNEKKIIKDLFERKERSLQRGYYSTRLKASSRSEKTNIINCLKAIYNRYAEMSENKNSKYSVFINSLATN